MKKFLSFVLMAVVAVAASAQITWNAKAGVGISSVISNADWGTSKIHFVGKLGAGMEYALSSNFSLMPSAEFAYKGAKFSNESLAYETNIYVFYFQIPVLAAYRFHLNNHLNLVGKVGPYFAFGLAGWFNNKYEDGYDIEEYKEDVFNYAERFEVGVDFGVDLEFKRWVVGAEYEIGITPLISGAGHARNSAFYVTAGYKF